MKRPLHQNTLITFLALLHFILPYLLQNSFYEPHRDEYLYLIEGRHPAWGYMEVPPMMSVLAWITHLFGDGFFWIKFWPSLTGSLCFVLTARIAVSLGGKNRSEERRVGKECRSEWSS